MGNVIWDLIVGPFAGWIAGAVGALVLLVGAWWSGRRSGAVARDLNAARAKDETRARMDEADAQVNDDDPAVLADWLRERGKR